MSSYIDHRSGPIADGPQPWEIIHDWRDFTYRRLKWHYEERAWLIHFGTDPATREDVARWQSLGRKVAA